jgi:acyl carrier protein
MSDTTHASDRGDAARRVREAALGVLSGIAPEADLAKLAEDANLRRALDLDSIDFQNFVIGLGKALGTDIPERDVTRLTTLAGCVGYLASRHGAAQ